MNPPAGGAVWERRAVSKDERRGVIKQGISRARELGHVILGFLPSREALEVRESANDGMRLGFPP